MAIDSKMLDDVTPLASAIARLKVRKNRIKPWQTGLITDIGSEKQVAPPAIPEAQEDENSNMSEKKDLSSLNSKSEEGDIPKDQIVNIKEDSNLDAQKPSPFNEMASPAESMQNGKYAEKPNTTKHNQTQLNTVFPKQPNTTKHNITDLETNTTEHNQTQLSEFEDKNKTNQKAPELNTTKHNNSPIYYSENDQNQTQLNTITSEKKDTTEHNFTSDYESRKKDNQIQPNTNFSKQEIELGATGIDAIKHKNPTIDRSENDLKQTQLNTLVSDKLNTTKHNTIDLETNTTEHKNSLYYSSEDSINQTQPNTLVSDKQNTTKHKDPIQSNVEPETKHNNRSQPNTTKHNRTPHQTQELNTIADHNQTQPNTTKQGKTQEQKQLSSYEDILIRLSGNPAKVISFLCTKSLESGDQTLQMSYEMLADISGVNVGSIKTTCARLKGLNLINIYAPSGGRNQFIGFEVSDHIKWAYSKVKVLATVSRFNIETTHNYTQKLNTTEHTTEHKPNTTLNTTQSREIDRVLNNTNLTSSSWTKLKNVDFSVLAPFSITVSIVGDFEKNGWEISKDQLETHIQRFYSLMTNPNHQAQAKLIKNPRAMFCNNVGRIAKTGLDPLDFIKTEEEEIFEALMEQRRKAQQEKAAKENEYIEFEFGIWLSNTSEETKTQLVPPQGLAKVGSVGHDQMLKAYFREMVWPELKRQILSQTI